MLAFEMDGAMGKGALGTYADSEGPDQTAHLRSLIRALTVRLSVIENCRK